MQQAEQFAQSLCLTVGVTLTISSSTATSPSSVTSTSSTLSSQAPNLGGAMSSYGINAFAAAAAILGVRLVFAPPVFDNSIMGIQQET
ncbi:hypothetical protein EDD15DRAFT_2370456 [Pisolithus albus]|nr:hypothetical protein EDD15DRAFT_2370456 [Pisolithus albus]